MATFHRIRPGGSHTAALPLLVAALLITGCEITDVQSGNGNTDMFLDADVVQTDTGVVVDGHPALSHPSQRAALWLDRTENFYFGGIDDTDYAHGARWSLDWRFHLAHEHGSVYRDRSATIRYLDHGTMAIEGVEATRITEVPGLLGRPGMTYESYFQYYLDSRYAVEAMDGSLSDYGLPFQDRVESGDELTLTTTGSDVVAPTRTTFATRPMARLIGVENGEAISLDRREVPGIRTDAPLTLIFDRPLDPARAAVLIWPIRGDGAPAWIQATEPASRWVIAADDLARLVAASIDDLLAYHVYVLEYAVQDSVVTGELADGTPYALPFVQRGSTTLQVHFDRGR